MTEHRYERLSTNNKELSPDGISNEEEIELNATTTAATTIKKEVRFQLNTGHSSSSSSSSASSSHRHFRERVVSTSSNFKIMHLAIGTLTIILVYLSLSICLTFYQKWILKTIEFPLTIVLYHLIIKFIMSITVRGIYKLTTGRSRVLLDWKTCCKKMAPTGMASGIDIGFSNWGLQLVKISLYTMTKSTTIIFILIFAIILGLEKKSWSLILIVVMIAGGLFMFTYKSTEFDAIGFIFLIFASFTSGIRWTFAQMIMQKSKLGLHNPVDMIFHMQPWMILSILPFTIGFEGGKILDVVNDLQKTNYDQIVMVLVKVSIGALIAFIMEISEFLVLSYTSSLTLSIAGIFKEISQLVLAVELNGDQLTLLNVLGLILCLGGICCHVIHKYSVLVMTRNDDNIFDIETNTGGDTSHVKNTNKTLVGFRKTALRKDLNKNGLTSQSNVPLLLENNDYLNSDSDDSQVDVNNQNASEVIFDVLKRRDHVR